MGGKLHARFRDMQTMGAAFVTLTVAAAAIGALATQGAKHPSRLLVDGVAIVALLGVVLVVVGWTGEHLTRVATVSEAHADTLRYSARCARDALIMRGQCDYGSGHKPREAFHSHYPTLSGSLDRWDSLLESDWVRQKALKERAEKEARSVALASEGRWSLDGGHIAAHIFDSTLSRAHKGDLAAAFSLEGGERRLATPGRDDHESQEDWNARVDRNIARVEAMGRASQDWHEAKAAAESHERLEEFERERAEAVQQLQLVLEHERPPVAKGCPTCEGKSS